MNLLLVEPHEVTGDTVAIADRRAVHARDVLGATVGSSLRAGVIGGALGTAEVLADDGARITLRLALTEPPSRPLPIELVLAVPRPKVLTRTVEAAAAFGVARLALTNSWRVDKSYLSSPRLAPDALAAAARLGAEQGATTHLPSITVHRRLMELLDARWPAPGDDLRLIAHPRAAVIASPTSGGARSNAERCGVMIEDAVRSASSVTIAIGPEGGWIERELTTFVERGFVAVSLGASVLRVDTAVAAALGQIELLQRIRSRG